MHNLQLPEVFYPRTEKGIFLERPNRFIAKVLIGNTIQSCHVKNTGRCRELLIPGAFVVLADSCNPARKTRYDLIAVLKGDLLVNIDSQAPNQAAAAFVSSGRLFPDITLVRREKTFGNSRFDLYCEHGCKKTFIEVKGVTLEEKGHARFPDAPTKRGAKHVLELIAAKNAGYEAFLLFVLQMMPMKSFSPNDATDPDFGAALRLAAKNGVQLLAYDCTVTENTMNLNQPVEILI